MPKRSWILTDVDADIYQEYLSLGPDQVGGPARNYSVVKRRLQGGRRDGVDVVEIDNGRLRFVVIPTRGMGLWRGRCGDVSLGWLSPVRGPVNPALVPVWGANGIGFLQGVDEFMMRCGLESNGAPEFSPNGALRYPLHGQVENTPAHKVELSIDGESGEIAISGVVDEARLFGSKLRLTSTIRTRVGSSELIISDEVQNISAEPGEMQLLYHVNFGMPLLTPGASVLLPLKKLVPRDAVAATDVAQWTAYGPEAPGLAEVCHFCQPLADAAGWSRALLRSAAGDKGASVKFNAQQLPYFTIWKSRQTVLDGYVTGLEPATNFPNQRSFEKEHGRVVALAPGERRRFDVAIEAHPDAASLAAAEKAIAAVQGSVAPEIWQEPDPNWSQV